MFEKGTYIVCGQHGVCRVDEIGKLKLSEASRDRDYYTLSKVYSHNGVLYIPTDSDKIIMRPVLSKDEAETLIMDMKDIEPLVIENEKYKDDIFKQAFRSCDNVEWIRAIKALYVRKQDRLARGKKVTASDERYLRTAEDNLYGELAISLNMDKRDVEEYINSRIEGEIA